MKKNNNKGFSLVELIVVIAIMAVLVGVLAPSLLRYVEKSRVQKDASAVAEVVEAAKIALANESVSKEVGSGADIVISAEGALTIACSGLSDEVTATVGDSISFSSTNAAEVTIEIEVDEAGNATFTTVTDSGTAWGEAVGAVK